MQALNISSTELKKACAATLPVLLAFVAAVYLTSYARGIPDLDYWDMFPSMLDQDGLNVTLGTLYKKSNEHIVSVTKLFYLLNYKLTGGDNFGLSVFASLFSLIIGAIFARVAAADSTSIRESLVIGASLAIFAFTPMAAHNYFIGMSGVAWLGANMFMVCAAFFILRGQSSDSLAAYFLALLFAALASQAYSTGLLAMCAIGIQGLMVRKSRRIGLLLLLLGIALILVVYAFQEVPAAHKERTFDPLQIASFSLRFIGAGLTTSASLALLWGGAGAIAFVMLTLRQLRNPLSDNLTAAFWIAIGCYALMNAGIAAIGRSALGGSDVAMVSRYASLPALFWIGLVGLILSKSGLLRAQGKGENQPRYGTVYLAVVAALTLCINAENRLRSMESRSSGKEIAALSLYLGIKDNRIIERHVTSAPGQVYRALPTLRQIKHVPFDGRFLGCPALGEKLKVSEQSTQAPIIGFLDGGEKIEGQQWYRVNGWALTPGSAAPPLLNEKSNSSYTCLVLINERDMVTGLGVGGDPRPDVSRIYKSDQLGFGWRGYAKMNVGAEVDNNRVYAAVKDPATHRWIKLSGSVEMID